MVAGLNPFLHHHHHNNNTNCLIINVIPIKGISLGPLTARPSNAPTFKDLVKFEIRHVHTAIFYFAWIMVLLVSHVNPFLITCKYLRLGFWIAVKPLFNFPAGINAILLIQRAAYKFGGNPTHLQIVFKILWPDPNEIPNILTNSDMVILLISRTIFFLHSIHISCSFTRRRTSHTTSALGE